MALYKYSSALGKSDSEAFDHVLEPGANAPWPGIYGCEVCGHEIATAANHVLPPQNHHQHQYGSGRIRWRLRVTHRKY
jgi:hypothetical protein